MRTCVNGLIDRLNINNSSYDWSQDTIIQYGQCRIQLVNSCIRHYSSIYATEVLIFSALRF